MSMNLRALGIGTLLFGLSAGLASAQAPARPAATPAPTTEAKVWAVGELDSHGKELLVTGANNWSFFSEKAYNAELRNLKGKQPVLQHITRADFMVVRSGGGTFTTGGELIGGKLQNPNGDLTGTGVKGGTSREVKAGDVIYIPPGVPHYFSNIPDHAEYVLVRWDAK